jgi:chromosome segregation ATPase
MFTDVANKDELSDVKQTDDTQRSSRQPLTTEVVSNRSNLSRAATDNDRDLAKDSVLISSHVQQLNNTIGAMRSERTELLAQIRKQQLRIVHLENMIDQLSKQVCDVINNRFVSQLSKWLVLDLQ